MSAGLTGWHLLIIVAVLVLIFGATRLPALSRGSGSRSASSATTCGARTTTRRATPATIVGVCEGNAVRRRRTRSNIGTPWIRNT